MFSRFKTIYRLNTHLFPRNMTKMPCFQRLSFSTSENVESENVARDLDSYEIYTLTYAVSPVQYSGTSQSVFNSRHKVPCFLN